jgi:hypothetical protein
MRSSSTVVACVLGTLVLASSARAESLEEKRFHDKHEKALKLNIDETNKRCGGATMTSSFDWSTFKFDDWQTKLDGMPYQSVGRAIIVICKGDDGKAAVKKGIKSVVIKGRADTPGLEIKDGVLTYWLSLGGAHRDMYDKAAVAALEKQL